MAAEDKVTNLALIDPRIRTDEEGVPEAPGYIARQIEKGYITMLALDGADFGVALSPDKKCVRVSGCSASGGGLVSWDVQPFAILQHVAMLRAFEGVDPEPFPENPENPLIEETHHPLTEETTSMIEVGICDTLRIVAFEDKPDAAVVYLLAQNTSYAIKIALRDNAALTLGYLARQIEHLGKHVSDQAMVALDVPYTMGAIYKEDDPKAQLARPIFTAKNESEGRAPTEFAPNQKAATDARSFFQTLGRGKGGPFEAMAALGASVPAGDVVVAPVPQEAPPAPAAAPESSSKAIPLSDEEQLAKALLAVGKRVVTKPKRFALSVLRSLLDAADKGDR